MLRRPAILAALLAAAVAMPSHAAPKPQITDAKGDGPQPGVDIVSVLWSTTGTGSGRRYVPKKLVLTMTLAGDVLTNPGITYEASAVTTTCETVTFSAQQGTPYSAVVGVNGWAEWGSCSKPTSDGDSNVELLTVAVKGNTLTWTMPIKMLPKGLTLGTVFSDFEARVDPTNPVVPFPSSLTRTDMGLLDIGTGTGTWKLG